MSSLSHKSPQLAYGDAYSIGQLAARWLKTPDFVRGLINRGDLTVDDRGLITNSELGRFYTSPAAVALD